MIVHLVEIVLFGKCTLMSQSSKSLRLLTRKPDIQLFRESLLGKNVHVAIPKGTMGYDQYTFPGTVDVEPTFLAFL